MLCSFIRLVRTIEDRVARALRAALDWAGRRLRGAWSGHLDNVSSSPAYAAATAAALSGLLGLLPMRDAIAAVLAAALGVCLKGTRPAGDSRTRWDDPWDAA